MKNTPFILLLFAVLISGCIVIPRPIPEARLTALPTPPHNRPVKIFFPGEAPPTEPYVKIKVLSVKRSAGVPTTNLVQELAQQAQREGADAILVLGKNVYSEIQTTTSTTMDSTGIQTSTSNTSWEWQDVSALAVKYLSRVDYLTDYVREQRLLHWADSAWQAVATGQVNYQAPTLWQPANDPWLANWKAYELENIPINSLKYSDDDQGLRVSKWFYGPVRDRKFRLHTTLEGRIESVDVMLLEGTQGGKKETLQYVYDSKGRLAGRTLHTYNWGTLLEQRSFDAAGKIQTIAWTQNGKPFLKMEFIYFQPEDVSAFLN